MTSLPVASPQVSALMADAVPEFYHYEDTGCEISDSCLNCPLPICRYDDPVWFQRNRRLAKDFKMWTIIKQEGLSREEAAERFAVTQRTIFRIINRCRDASLQVGNEELLLFAAD